MGCVSLLYSVARSEYLKHDSIMAQLTLCRFRGDTAFGFVTRIISTIVGGIIGTVMWFVFPCIRTYNMTS